MRYIYTKKMLLYTDIGGGYHFLGIQTIRLDLKVALNDAVLGNPTLNNADFALEHFLNVDYFRTGFPLQGFFRISVNRIVENYQIYELKHPLVMDAPDLDDGLVMLVFILNNLRKAGKFY
jgi:hypothetical protein